MTPQQQALVSLISSVSFDNGQALQSPGTPQHQAMQWLLQDVDNSATPSSSDNNAKLIQRYVLAVLFFAWNGHEWDKRHMFATGVHECSWFDSNVNRDEKTYALGVTCDSNLHVQNLLLRKFCCVETTDFLLLLRISYQIVKSIIPLIKVNCRIIIILF